MPSHHWYDDVLAWIVGSPDTLSVHFCLLVMLAAAMLLRRSLGAWPVWWSAFFGAMLIEGWWLLNGIAHAPWPLGLLNMLAMPTLIFLLARAQRLPGLRRGEMTPEQRKRWVAARAFAPEVMPADHRHNLLGRGRV